MKTNIPELNNLIEKGINQINELMFNSGELRFDYNQYTIQIHFENKHKELLIRDNDSYRYVLDHNTLKQE